MMFHVGVVLLSVVAYKGLAAPGPLCEFRTSAASLEFVGQLKISTGSLISQVNGAPVPLGGISGLDYDACNDTYYLLSDDRSQLAPARFYSAKISTSTGVVSLDITGVTLLRDAMGNLLPANSVDPEGIRLSRDRRSIYWTSEGEVNPSAGRITNPSLKEVAQDTGVETRSFKVPLHFLPVVQDTNNNGVIDTGDVPVAGVRNNLAFEGLALTPGSGNNKNTALYIGTEDALFQDGNTASLTARSLTRITKYDTATGEAVREYVYTLEKIPVAPVPASGFANNGVAEIFAVGLQQLLVLERAFAVGVGNTIRLFEVDLKCATNVLAKDSLVGATYTPAKKTLIADIGTVAGVPLDNLECISIKRETDGSLTLLLMSDNNFSSTQFTQVLAFKLNPSPTWSPGIGKCYK